MSQRVFALRTILGSAVCIVLGLLPAAAADRSRTTLVSSAKPVVYGTSFTLTATVTPTGAAGAVRFQRSSGILLTCAGGNPAPVTAGQATCAVADLGAGTFTLVAAYLGSDATASSSASLSQTVSKADQTITFPPLADKPYGAPSFDVTARASSGLPVKLATDGTRICRLDANKLSLTGAGTCTVRASQSGNANYYAAASVDRSFSVAPVSAIVTLDGLQKTYRGRAQSATCATVPSGLRTTISYSDMSFGIDRINAGKYGVTCDVVQAGYTGAANGILTIAKASQIVDFASLAAKTYGDAPFVVTATARSGLPVNFTSLTPDVCALSGNVVSLENAGTCTVLASQPGNANYEPAADVNRSFVVSVRVTLGNLTQTYDGTVKSAGCTTAPAGIATSLNYRDVGAGTGRINAGNYGVTCKVTDARYTGRATGTLSIARAGQTITFNALPGKTMGDPPFNVAATASSSLAVSITSLTAGICNVAGNAVTLNAVGTCTLQANQAGNGNYNAAPSVDQSFSIEPVSQDPPPPPPSNTHYLVAYDSALKGDWNLALWVDDDHPIFTNVDAAAPGGTGRAIEAQFSPNGWAAFGLANMRDWNNINYMYLNEFRTIEFDIYFAADSTGMENLQFVLDDVGYSSQPRLVSFIPAWVPGHPESIRGQWFHIAVDLTRIGVTIPRFTRFLLQNTAGAGSQPHFYMANVRLGWVDDVTPPVVTLVSAIPNLTYDQLTLNFTTDEAATYRVEYGVGNYNTTIQGPAGGWALNHAATLTGLSRGQTVQYRITALNHHTDPNASPTPGTLTGSYAMPPVPTSPPVISSFTATPLSVPIGESSTLTWVATDYETLSIDQGVGSVAQISGSRGVLVSPRVTTDYTITATNTAGTATRTVTVSTLPVPVVHSFTASPSKIGPGGTSTLIWNIDSFDTLTIDHGIGNVTAIPGTTGVPVHPSDTTTYTITATNAYATVLQTATLTVNAPLQHPLWVMGYYVGYQSALQPPDKVDYSAMTHIMVGAALPRTNGTWDTSFYIDNVNGPAWARDTVNRAHAAGTKAILMLGGAGAVAGFRATTDPAVRAAFVSNLKAFVDSVGFDGIDLDWEPLETQADFDALIVLVQAMQAPGLMPRSQYIYTLPIGWNNSNFNNMGDPFFPTAAPYFDRLNIMSYGMVWFGGGWQSWHSSPLFGQTPSTPSSIDNTVQVLRTAGVPAEKIGVGVGFYGTPYENGVWQNGAFVHQSPPDIPAYVTAPHQSTDTAGNRYNDNQASYSNIVRYMFAENAYRWDDTSKVPYLSFANPRIINIPGQVVDLETTYVTYDNEQAIAEKGSYVRKNGLGGVIVWTISQGYLGDWKTTGEIDPLMKAVKEAFLNN